MICHVLRYAPFYVKVKDILMKKTLGEIQSVYCSENVWIPHILASYIRGKWNSEKACGSGMLMAKCCHDIDLIVWLVNDQPAAVSSFGARSVFNAARKPAGAGERCLDCSIESTCPYSAKKLFLENDLFGFLVWSGVAGKDWSQVTPEEKLHSMKTDNPHGACAYCDKDLVDHQTVSILFENGATALLNMTGGASRAGRELHIVCERGEIEGFLEGNSFVVRQFNADMGAHIEEKVEITEDVSGAHSGGDLRLVEDFVATLAGGTPSISCTSIEDSVVGHQIVIAAEKSRKEKRTVHFN
jgi:predicted dehydrogenase